MRSLLFVPGDRPDRMDKALHSGADALILDLEDSVSPQNKPAARKAVSAFLATARQITIFVRINPITSPLVDDDLQAIAHAAPHGIVLPKAEGGAATAELHRRLTARGNTTAKILPIATETAASIFLLPSFRDQPRLCGLTWGAEDLSADLGASTAREPDGAYTAPYQLARSLALFAAHAAGLPAIETVYPDISDPDGLAAYAARGARDGFTAMLAIHPAQIPIINAAFTPPPEAVAHARAIVEAFAANPSAGVLQLDGKMIDAPHLKQARRVLGKQG